jgi:hypothetical protein
MVTTLLADTADVVIVNDAVKLLAGAVVVAGTLATAELLLDREISAPPSQAPVLRTAVPLEGLIDLAAERERLEGSQVKR